MKDLTAELSLGLKVDATMILPRSGENQLVAEVQLGRMLNGMRQWV